jgi:glycosidase
VKQNALLITCTGFPPLPSPAAPRPWYEFHIHSALRKKYEIDDALFQSTGNVIFPNFRAVRLLAQKMNEDRDLAKHPELAVRAGQLNAMGLIDEIYHYILRVYEETTNRKVFVRANEHLARSMGEKPSEDTLLRFNALFPPMDVYRGGKTAAGYLGGSTADVPHTAVTIEEMILLWFANFNPAFAPFRPLFDDTDLVRNTMYSSSISSLDLFFRKEKPFGPKNEHIFDLLKAPILASPNSLEGQLEYIRMNWGLLISGRFMTRILGARDLIVEDMRIVQPGGEGASELPDFRQAGRAGDPDYERFTADIDWMPKVVIVAKNTYVWLDQLSRKYKRKIRRIDEIPDEELDQLARWNFTGLWLIGVWERSRASQTIKLITGNADAVSSAYSIYDYNIAEDLGGEEAFQNLRRRAWQRGIRLAGDMVPNHMGIYSRWVVEHPEYFIQSTWKPFPNYQFTGPSLSADPRIDIRIEDGYWNRRDAAVVFQRLDTWTGDVRYIYHGNDGTSMPWNDTAQLDFLNPEVREAVIQMIFHTARKFSIIRFDAAMVLAKRHFQRLWYPQPGSGGAIPSRSDHALSREDFDRAIPQEFWREVVDRINAELPDTLLLAEAFWLLEGYFVRTLGMHRVYNSAFMNMLKREENPKYRELIRSTLHYNPEILKRYVNFMSNPDEETAIAQFGKDDKYFGVAVLLVTLPGLPMFGHGQIEGFTEKYGMEYQRSYYDEHPDEHLVRRHEHEIFPLMQRRHLFSQVADFELYDFTDPNGSVNENVFAYSNRSGDERALICYHNKYEETAGWIRRTAGKAAGPAPEGAEAPLRFGDLGTSLGLNGGDGWYYLFTDYRTHLQYIRSGRELCEQGLFVELKAFQYHVFLDFREVFDSGGEYRNLAHHLEGRGVHDINMVREELRLASLHAKFRELIAGATQNAFALMLGDGVKNADAAAAETLILNRYREFLNEVVSTGNLPVDDTALTAGLRDDCSELRRLCGVKSPKQALLKKILEKPADTLLLLTWLVLRTIGADDSRRLLLGKVYRATAAGHGIPDDEIGIRGVLLELLLSGELPAPGREGGCSVDTLSAMLSNSAVQDFLRVHWYDGIVYFNKERFESMIDWLCVTGELRKKTAATVAPAGRTPQMTAEEIKSAAERSGYEFEQFLIHLEQSTKPSAPKISGRKPAPRE